MKRHLAVSILLVSIGTPLAARAELLWFKDAPQDSVESAREIQAIGHAQRFFGKLDSSTDVDFFTFSADAKQKVDLLLETPVADGDFKPELILFGPGLTPPKEDPTIAIGESNGAVIAHAKDRRDTRFDDFLLTTFNEGPTLSIDAPEKASYAIAIKDVKGSKGRYVLHVGTENAFRWDELWQGITGTLKGLLRLY